MKTILISLAIVFSAALAHAELPAGYTKVPEEQNQTYARAIRSAIAQNPSAVSVCDPRWIEQTLNYFSEVLVQDASAQPLLMLNAYYPNQSMHRMVITTDATLKKITQVVAEVYQMGEVNKGDLAHPVIVQDYVLQNRSNCTAQPHN